ncbi:N-ATPase subunit AtpR [Futiania mangrovi]|uniref:ATP synthase subunit I n=1 Tax=Futiania mangrovi TaxID=2959716 RepID=A0A9J6PEL7_9PROT|nr:ATP synthase subunit I [Futiania mangrovii]MCP1335071.1 hypothetical protein [Futiania mangrovii]
MSAAIPYLLTLLAGVAGFAAGWLHFRTLLPLTERILERDWRAVGLQVLRLALLAGFLVLCAQAGLFPLLAAAAGVFAARAMVIRKVRRELP